LGTVFYFIFSHEVFSFFGKIELKPIPKKGGKKEKYWEKIYEKK
jgi:hypothetical protein